MGELDRIAALLAEAQRTVERMKMDAGGASAPAATKVDPKDLVTVQQAAGLLNMHPRTVERRIERGLIPSYKISCYVFVPKSALSRLP